MDQQRFMEWEHLLKNLADFDKHTSAYFHNAPYALQKCKDLLLFMKEEVPSLRQWCNSYLESNRNEIYIKYWVEYGWTFLNGYNHGINNIRHITDFSQIHKDFQSSWKKICSDLLDKSKIFPEEEIDFDRAYFLLKESNRIQSTSFCTVPEILEIHKDKPCISNGWFCDYCEDMEHIWHRYLIEKLKREQNIFLNKGVKVGFLEEAIKISIVPEGWKPPSENYQIYRLDLETDGKTPYQIMYKIVEFAKWNISIWKPFRSDFEKFCALWIFIESIEKKLEVLENACSVVEKIINGS